MPLADRPQWTEKHESSGAFGGSKDAKNDLDKLLKWLGDCERSLSETRFRTESSEDYAMYAGEQDPPDVKEALALLNRPVSVYNEIKPKVDMLVGLAAQARNEMTVVPVGIEDEPLAELLQGVVKFFGKKTSIQRKLLECFEHGIKSGRSFLHFYVDRSNPLEPQIKIKRLDSYAVWLDPECMEYDLSDARYVFIEKWMTEEDIKTYWPGFDIGLASQMPGAQEMPAFFNENNEKFRIVECWYRKKINVIWFTNPMTGKTESLEPKEFKKFQEIMVNGKPEINLPPQKPVEGYPAVIDKVHYAIFCGGNWLEGGQSPYRFNDFPLVFFGAYKNVDENRWFGVVNMMKDPQRALNTMRRQLSHLLQTLPKGILMHEAGAILNIEEYEQRSSDPTFHLEVAAGKMDRVQFIQQPAISPIYQVLDSIYSQSMKDASGIQDTLMGVQTSSREPGITVAKRQETGLAVLYTLYDNFSETRLKAGKLLLSFIQQYITMPMVVRIEGPSGMQLAQINSQMNPQSTGFNDISSGDFDVVLDETIETKTSRQSIAQILSEYSHNNPGLIPPDIILDYSDVPYSVKQRVRANWEAQQKAQQEQVEFERKLEIAKLDQRQRETQIKASVQLETAKQNAKQQSKKG